MSQLQWAKLADFVQYARQVDEEQWTFHPASLQIRTHFREMVKLMLVDSFGNYLQLKTVDNTTFEIQERSEQERIEDITTGVALIETKLAWRLQDKLPFVRDAKMCEWLYLKLSLDLCDELFCRDTFRGPARLRCNDRSGEIINRYKDIFPQQFAESGYDESLWLLKAAASLGYAADTDVGLVLIMEDADIGLNELLKQY